MKKTPIIIVSLALITLIGCSSHQIRPSSPLIKHCEDRSPDSEDEIAALFDLWNQALQTGDARKVVALYAERSILLPTLSNKPR